MFNSYLVDDVLGLLDLEAERELLAVVASDPTYRAFWEVDELLPSPEVFVGAGHKELWQQMGQAVDEGKPFEPLFDERTSGDPVAVAKVVVDLYERRLLASFGDSFWKRIHDREIKPGELIAGIEERLNWVRDQRNKLQTRRLTPLVELFDVGIKQAFEAYALRQKNPDGVFGISSGLRQLDETLGGFQTGIHVWAAPPGVGKTALMRHLASVAALTGNGALFLSFEEEVETLAFRLMCSNAEPDKLKPKQYLEGHVDPQGLHDIAKIVGPKLKNLFLIQGTGATSAAEVKNKIRLIKSRTGCERVLLIVDYLQHWASKTQSTKEYRHQVGGLLTDLRSIAIEEKIPALVISSQNRQGYDKPGFASLKESGELEYGADTVTFLVDEDEHVGGEKRKIRLEVTKNRFGPKGQVQIVFDPETGVFCNYAGLGSW